MRGLAVDLTGHVARPVLDRLDTAVQRDLADAARAIACVQVLQNGEARTGQAVLAIAVRRAAPDAIARLVAVAACRRDPLDDLLVRDPLLGRDTILRRRAGLAAAEAPPAGRPRKLQRFRDYRETMPTGC